MRSVEPQEDDETARSWEINTALAAMQDQRRFADQSLRAMTAQNDAVDRDEQDRQEMRRALAIANTPGVSQYGRPIVQTGPHSYATGAPEPGPVNRQQIAAQMAPGLIAPPGEPAKVTFAAPQAVVVDGKRVFARAGSDGQMYGMDRKPITAEALTPEPKPEAAGRAPNYEWAQTPDGSTKLMTPEEIRAEGGRKPQGAMEAMDERKYKKAAPVMRGINELTEKINTQQGLLAKMSGGAAKLAAKANYDDDVAEYTALVSGFTPMVARALGHTGVLTQQDVDSVKSLFPLPGDSKTLRDRKMNRVLGIIGELEGATNAPKGGSGGGTVELIAPDGGILDVPASEVEALLKAGAKRKGGG